MHFQCFAEEMGTTVGEAAKLAPKRIEIPGRIEHRASTSR